MITNMPFSALAGALLMLMPMFATGCAPAIRRSGYTTADLKPNNSCDVRFEYRSQLGPNQARELGRIRVEDSGFSTHCSEPEVREIVRRDACGLRADIVDIQEEKAPSVMATCYHVDARLLALKDGASKDRFLANPPPLEKESRDSVRAKSAKDNNRKFVRTFIIVGVAAGVAAGVTAGLVTAL